MAKSLKYLILLLTLVLWTSVSWAQVNTFQAEQATIVAIQNQLNQLQTEISNIVVPPTPVPQPTTGVYNVKSYGAIGNFTDDTLAIQTARTNAGTNCVYFPNGTYIVTKDLNFTSSTGQSVCIRGEDPAHTIILCEDAGGNCLDLSGTDAYNIENIQVQGGTSAANAPATTILLARTGSQGFGHSLTHVWTVSFGTHTIYDYGNEVGTWRDVRSQSSGVVFSACNSIGIHSQYQSLVAAPTSMSDISIFGGNFRATGGNCSIYLDNACTSGEILNIDLYSVFFGEDDGGATAICDVGGGSNQVLQSIAIYNGRMEAGDSNTSYKYVDFSHSYTYGLNITGVTLGTPPVTVSPFNFGAQAVDNSYIEVDSVPVAGGVPVLTLGAGRADTIRGIEPTSISTDLQNGNSGGNGDILQWFDSIDFGYVDAGGWEPMAVLTQTAGTTAGFFYWSMPGHSRYYKQVLIQFAQYQNNTATPQVINLPINFDLTPSLAGGCGPTSNVVTPVLGAGGMVGQLQLPVSMSATYTGQCLVVGS